MEHVWGRELWTHERGVAMFEGRPWWKSDLLPAGTVKPLLHAQHATDSYDALQFVDGNVRFERAISGETTYQLDCPVTTVLSRDHVLRAWVRYLGADGWTGYGPYAVEVGFLVTLASDGSFVERDSIVGRLTSETEIPYDRDFVGIGYDGSRQFDGWVREWETRRNPLHAQEIERL
jgi:hypothetical protein